ncbi:MAG: putative glyoxalase family protein [Hydrocarboniphaga sp.]|uniref:VOC family protein n=1 Tax=Hydrocarboniphaga sp. TaxID=2033016 RepID=UPI00261BBB78|nr:VOC family protein [Hydrocarboniphaga sp.]MDB5967794.1 putative glyoxalase family protein [Hydrocarboniphaga sp.]
MTTITPYLSLNGQCEAAFKFYEQHLGGKIEAMMTFGETPACGHVSADHQKKIMHACIALGEQRLMGSDGMPEEAHNGVKGCSVALGVDSIAEAERIFAALSQNGTVEMALDKTFWAVRFGAVTDQFGVPWLINCEKDG